MTGPEMRAYWEQSSLLKAEWDAVLQSPAWKFLSEMIVTEEIERAETFDNLAHADPVLARNLAALKGARRAIKALTDACKPEPVHIPLPEEFSHIQPTQIT